MSNFNLERVLAAVLAVAIALRADIGTPPIPEDYRSTVAWVLTGVIAGLTMFLGPQIADAVKNALKGKPPTEPPA